MQTFLHGHAAKSLKITYLYLTITARPGMSPNLPRLSQYKRFIARRVEIYPEDLLNGKIESICLESD
jgi:hypothetical protein